MRRIIENRFGREHAPDKRWAICGDLNDYLRAVRQNLDSPVPADLLAEKAAERTWQHLEPEILGLYDRLTGFVHTPPPQEFPPMTVVEAAG